MTDGVFLFFNLIVLVFSVVVHEVSHGYVADRLGDPTARLSGRLTLNPLRHIDPMGSVIVPLLLHISGLPMIGWAKPVPYNPMNLRDPIGSGAKIAAAGPISNLALAAVFGLLIRIFGLTPETVLFSSIILINVSLAIFNLIPIPPLDGSKVLFAVLPINQSTVGFVRFLEQYGFVIIILLVFSGLGAFIVPIIHLLFFWLTGIQF